MLTRADRLLISKERRLVFIESRSNSIEIRIHRHFVAHHDDAKLSPKRDPVRARPPLRATQDGLPRSLDCCLDVGDSRLGGEGNPFELRHPA